MQARTEYTNIYMYIAPTGNVQNPQNWSSFSQHNKMMNRFANLNVGFAPEVYRNLYNRSGTYRRWKKELPPFWDNHNNCRPRSIAWNCCKSRINPQSNLRTTYKQMILGRSIVSTTQYRSASSVTLMPRIVRYQLPTSAAQSKSMILAWGASATSSLNLTASTLIVRFVQRT